MRFRSAAWLLPLAFLAGCSSMDLGGFSSDSGSTGTQTSFFGQRTPARNVRLQITPVIGADAAAVPALSSRLQARASQQGLPVTSDAGSATHILKGYFSTITENGQTTVIYVWDVLDPAGNRLHRIQGQERATGGSGEGWPAVTDATMEAVADRTVDELASWLASNAA
ncbi:hypothetical protein [Chelativorans sp. Marseille-P2723]|uniref:hypothetical protein n=1 Tax=Chelativorans sp. Marseille-P2723 TaxID=2709133 RepID=UPI0015715CD2|nr:hypothetical protein [Chelativorans sp. Marseille-P2723]